MDLMSSATVDRILQRVQERASETMRKAVDTSAITSIVPEDLEKEAYIAQWDPANRNTLSALKLLPSTPAYQIEHKFPRLTTYGADRGFGAVGERSLPVSTQPGFEQVTVNIRLVGAMSEVYKLAAMERTVNVAGNVGASAITKMALFRSLLWAKNLAIYFADTTTQRSGTSGILPKGIIQQIREGTDGTVGTASRFGSHIIDAEGQPLTRSLIRSKAANLILNFGFPSTAVMSPHVRADFEASLDAAERLAIPAGGKGIVLGQNVGGMQTNGGVVAFHTDIMLDPIYYQRQYRAVADDGAPGRPTATAVAGAVTGDNVSAWDAASAGSWIYIITESRDGRESLGRILTAVAVSAGQEVVLTLTPSDPYSDSFRVYRILSGGASTDAYSIFDVANDQSGGAVTAYDLNNDRPGTHTAIFMDVASQYQDDAAQGLTGNLKQMSSGEQMAAYFRQSDSAQNAVTVAHLGGAAFQSMELAPVLMTETRPLLFSPYSPELRGPKKCFVVKNITPSVGT